MNDIPKALSDMLEPLVQLERLESWAGPDESSRFFDITRLGPHAWEVVLYLDLSGRSPETPIEDLNRKGRGSTMAYAIQNALALVEAS